MIDRKELLYIIEQDIKGPADTVEDRLLRQTAIRNYLRYFEKHGSK